MKLTQKQEAIFNSIESGLRKEVALEYIKDGYENGTKAYLNACKNLNRKPSKNPETSASEILSYPNVVSFINSVQTVVAEEAQIDAAWLLNRLKEIDELDVLDIMTDDLTSFKSLSEWPKVWRTSLSGFDLSMMIGSDDTESFIKKIKWPDKVKNLEMIGRHVNVKAWDKEEVKPAPTGITINFTDAVKVDAD